MTIYSPIIITEEIERHFKPTRLAVKELNGIKYFCMTSRPDFNKYHGSGKHWKRIVKKYGKKNVKTLWVSDWFYCPHHIQEFALMFSEYNQVVESEEWANLIPEHGIFVSPMVTQSVKDTHKKSCKKAGNVPEVKQKRIDQLMKWREEPGKVERCVANRKITLSDPSVNKKFREACKAGHNTPERKGKRGGRGNSAYDHTIYRFVHKDGTVIDCTRHDLQVRFNLRQSNLSQLISGGKKSHIGWTLLKTE